MNGKPTKPAHDGSVRTPKSFTQAYESISAKPDMVYRTLAGTPFTAKAGIARKGQHINEQVIIFKQNGKEMARSYSCCWGHRTNCNRTYIDSYSPCV